VVGKGFSSSVPVISIHGQCDALGVNEPKLETYDKSIVPPPETITSKTLAVAISLSTINECPAPDSTIIPSPSKGVSLKYCKAVPEVYIEKLLEPTYKALALIPIILGTPELPIDIISLSRTDTSPSVYIPPTRFILPLSLLKKIITFPFILI